MQMTKYNFRFITRFLVQYFLYLEVMTYDMKDKKNSSSDFATFINKPTLSIHGVEVNLRRKT